MLKYGVLLELQSLLIASYTEIRHKAIPRLRDLASWPPLAAGASSRNLGPTL